MQAQAVGWAKEPNATTLTSSRLVELDQKTDPSEFNTRQLPALKFKETPSLLLMKDHETYYSNAIHGICLLCDLDGTTYIYNMSTVYRYNNLQLIIIAVSTSTPAKQFALCYSKFLCGTMPLPEALPHPSPQFVGLSSWEGSKAMFPTEWLAE